jgi:hypothetical protein
LIHPLLVLVLFHANCLWELGNGRGGAAQKIKRDGRILGIIFVVIFFVLVSDASLLQSDIGIVCSYHMLGHWLIWDTTSGILWCASDDLKLTEVTCGQVLVYSVGCVAGRTASREHYGDV